MKLKYSRGQSPSTAHWILMVPVMLLVAYMAAQGLGADLIWYDELTSISHAGGMDGPFSLVDVTDSVREHSPKHTPFFFQLVANWAALVGWHHIVLRVLPLYFGIIALAWIYRLGADFIDRWSGILAAAFLGLNVFWLDYLHEIRMYSLQFMLILALAWHYFYVINDRDKIRKRHWIGLTVSAALCLYAQPFSIFFHVGLGLHHLLFVKRGRAWYQVALAMLIAGLMYLPWLPVTQTGLTLKFDTGSDAIALQDAIHVFVRLLGNGNPLVLVIALVAALYQARQSDQRRRMLKFWFLSVAVLVVLLVVNEAVGLIPLRRSRYFFVTWGMWALVIGQGLASFRWRWIPLAILAVYLLSGLELRRADDYLQHQGTVGVVHAYPPMDKYVEALRGNAQPLDYLVGFSDTGFVNARGKRGKSTADYYLETLLGIDGTFVPNFIHGEQLAADLAAMLDDQPYLLLTYDPSSVPPNLAEVQMLLSQDYQPCDLVLEQPSLLVQRYVDRSVTCERVYQPIHYDNGIRIVDKFAQHDREERVIRVVTGWEVEDKDLLEKFNVSIQIIDANWQNKVQAPDRHLYDDVLKWHEVELSTAALPPGEYRVVVIVYDRHHSSDKVNGADLTSGEVGSILPLFHFTIEA